MFTEKNEIVVKHKTDVLVAGGGIAGIAAALSAARHGAKVLLVEKSCILGGLATSGLIAMYLPLCDGNGNQVSFGIAEELLKLSVKCGIAESELPVWLSGATEEQKKKQRYAVNYNPTVFALEAERLLLQNNVDILYDTRFCSVKKRGKTVTHIILENKSGRTAVFAKTIVDASGDADIFHFAKAPTKEFEEKNLLAAWYYILKDGKNKLNPMGAADTVKTAALVDKRFTGLDGDEISEMLTESHRFIYEDMLKRIKADKDFAPLTLPTIPQLRMTRCIIGEYMLDVSDEEKEFKDSIGIIGNWRKRGPSYEIPFSSLYSPCLRNVISAGRCISTTDKMWDLTRVIPACAVTGQAAGTAAALFDDFSKADVDLLRSKLKSDGVPLNKREVIKG